ncbi:ABC transporter substrate-binding protein [Cellulomonas hominis]|uniref:ABC transporter substrate-binding protein n=1 Tax=Cellulomonas hominis TaxID=156981 RepID=A0A7Z8K0L6_9CELL|nr:ABC transporter substrate-binding protein [Cellulomonas hominis]TKR23607.1 ABC transporter substrate-binding protein [Cellulomonas hominis]
MSPSTARATTRSARRTSPRTRTAAAAATAVAGLLALTACGQSGTVSGSGGDDTFTAVMLTGYTTPPDPDVNYDGPGLNIIENTYEGLVAYQDGVEEPTIVPELAEEWTVSDDGLTYTFTLRPGVTFHDGTELTSQAVKASFERRTQVDAGPAYMVGDVVSVETPDDLTAVVTLAAPNAAFLDYLASPFGVKLISPTVLADEAGDDVAQTYLTTHDAGTGPYELTAVETGERYELTAYDGYWGDAPALTSVELQIAENASSAQLQLERGEIDAILGNLNKTSFESFADSEDVTTSTFPNFTTQMVYVNPGSSWLPTPEDREALFAGIDKESVIAEAMGSLEVPTDQLFPQGMVDPGIDDQGITYDEGAWDALGAPDSGTVRIAYAGSSADGKAVAEELGSRLSTAGIPAEAVAYSAGTIYGIADEGAAGPDLAVFSVFPDAGHPDAWASIIYTPAGGLDLFGAEVPGLTDLLGAARASEDVAAYAPAADAINATRYWYSIGSLNTTLLTTPDVTGTQEAQNVLEYDVLHFAALGRG